MKKIIVCGSRDFADRDFLERKLSKLTAKLTRFELVTGACPTGADRMAEDWAFKQFPARTVIRKRFPARWDEHGRGAGPMRNYEMGAYVGKKGVCIAFRKAAGPSPGTDDMVRQAKKVGMKVIVYRVG